VSPRRRYRVHGRVQRVGFRWFVVRRARAAGVSGAVRNEADGTVTVLAEGEASALDELRRGLEEGPPAARVERVLEEDAGGESAAGYDAVF
jgi:acylphosphatase